ncbi:hypothetical protein [Neisseria meningitidis]|uniref:hypothetical protein n=1 Tax=Neisseria meningitidis TaxID=487 RepID=UPI001E3247E5|nr:hypothetical protein [Neisseria meningitidis]
MKQQKNRTRKQYGFCICCLKTSGFHTNTNRIHFRTGYAALIYPDKPCPDRKYSGLTKTSTALPRLSSKRTIL